MQRVRAADPGRPCRTGRESLHAPSAPDNHFPDLSAAGVERLLAIGAILAVLGTIASLLFRHGAEQRRTRTPADAVTWRMPPASLSPPKLTALIRLWLIVLRGYFVIAVIMVAMRVAQLAHQGTAS